MNPESDETSPAVASFVWWRRYPSTPRSVTAARHHVVDVLTEWGVGEDGVASAELVVSELVTNAVRHGLVPGRLVELRVTYDLAKLLTVEVSDAGDRWPPAWVPEDPGGAAESGRGLALVAAFSDGWGVRDREIGKTVWAHLRAWE
ncbi:ATP-binding protein [Streptomyces sp. RKND-216]|uniref:ATP-binding protein n=1 Tax=Streptomyces sp. RKND-216 TaxID=2562581 RepID=UPI00109D9790|nr:ATP-binding protein [Streptomyces sp. RKND-216]THA25529.1 ATP-binding protein [Streptomyces sp. RKND-216]